MPRENMTFEEDVIDRLARIETSAAQLSDHEPRIRVLEQHNKYQLGVISGLSLVGGSVASWIVAHFKLFA